MTNQRPIFVFWYPWLTHFQPTVRHCSTGFRPSRYDSLIKLYPSRLLIFIDNTVRMGHARGPFRVISKRISISIHVESKTRSTVQHYSVNDFPIDVPHTYFHPFHIFVTIVHTYTYIYLDIWCSLIKTLIFALRFQHDDRRMSLYRLFFNSSHDSDQLFC